MLAFVFPELDPRNPFLVKRVSNTSGALFYQAITSPPPATAPQVDTRHSHFLSGNDVPRALLICRPYYL